MSNGAIAGLAVLVIICFAGLAVRIGSITLRDPDEERMSDDERRESSVIAELSAFGTFKATLGTWARHIKGSARDPGPALPEAELGHVERLAHKLKGALQTLAGRTWVR